MKYMTQIYFWCIINFWSHSVIIITIIIFHPTVESYVEENCSPTLRTNIKAHRVWEKDCSLVHFAFLRVCLFGTELWHLQFSLRKFKNERKSIDSSANFGDCRTSSREIVQNVTTTFMSTTYCHLLKFKRSRYRIRNNSVSVRLERHTKCEVDPSKNRIAYVWCFILMKRLFWIE
jgi:hypothetical protein